MKKIQEYRGTLLGACIVVVISGCSMLPGKEDAAPKDVMFTKPLQVDLQPDFRPEVPVKTAAAPVPVTRTAVQQPRNCGNEPVYTLNGRSYQVLPSAKGYRQEGMASRYAAQYQGSATAGCERFDQYAFTAAHRTLPLPSFVKVTNLQNNKSVIVKVNDRGPFDGGGLIRLSFAAASTLGMNAQNATARVRVEAAGARPPASMGRARAKVPIAPAVKRPQAVINRPRAPQRVVNRPKPRQSAAVKKAKQSGKSFFVVVKNYPTQADALDLFVRLTSVGLKKTELASAVNNGRKVHQVRVGPLYTQDQIDSVKDTLASNGLATFRVVEVDQ